MEAGSVYICCVSAFSREEAAHQINPDEKAEKKNGVGKKMGQTHSDSS